MFNFRIKKILDERMEEKTPRVERFAAIEAPKKPQHKKRKIVLLSAGLAATITLTTLLGVFLWRDKQTPRYIGMSVANHSLKVAKPQLENDSSTLSTSTISSLPPVSSSSDGGLSIDNNSEHSPTYYVQPGEIFTVEVHISNPLSFEILSFTLNGEKYANYMFKEGSTLEVLLLDVTAPTTPGYTDYTIDAIKYVDGTAIKDVRMDGDRSIRIGVAYADEPKAELNSLALKTDGAEISIIVKDPQNAIGTNPIFFRLFDQEILLKEEPLLVGSNSLTLSDLEEGKTYLFGVDATFDMAKGDGPINKWIFARNFVTLTSFAISSLTSDKTSINFSINERNKASLLQGVSLIDSDQTTVLKQIAPTSQVSFTNLLSAHSYYVALDYTYYLNGESHSRREIQQVSTLGKTAPEVSLSLLSLTDAALAFTATIADPDTLISFDSIDLLKDGAVVQSVQDIHSLSFSDLASFSNYTLRVIYSYDLNDGTGIHHGTKTIEAKTNPYLKVLSYTLYNSDALFVGDTLVIDLEMENPSSFAYKSLSVNGKEYSIEAGTSANSLLFHLANSASLSAGDQHLIIDYFTGTIGTSVYKIVPKGTLDIPVTIHSLLTISSFSYGVRSGSQYQARSDSVFPSEELCYYLTIDNPGAYQLDSITIGGEVYTSSSIIIVDASHYAILLSQTSGWIGAKITAMAYSKGSLKKNITVNGEEIRIYGLKEDGIKTIQTVADFKAMLPGNYYQLTADLDCGNSDVGVDSFNGVFDGNGHTIANYAFVGSFVDMALTGGLFKSANGVFTNLIIKDPFFYVTLQCTNMKVTSGPAFGFCYGSLIAQSSGSLIVRNIKTVMSTGKKSSLLSVSYADNFTEEQKMSSQQSYVLGGLIGDIGSLAIDIADCSNTMSLSGPRSINSVAGGIIGSAGSGGSNFTSTFHRLRNDGAIDALTAAGIIGCNCFQGQSNAGGFDAVHGIQDSINTGAISGGEASGIGGAYAYRCSNYGKISVSSVFPDCNHGSCYGITDGPQAKECLNEGAISGYCFAGGIAESATDCLNHGQISFTPGANGVSAVGGIAASGQVVRNCMSDGFVASGASWSGGISGIQQQRKTSEYNCLYLAKAKSARSMFALNWDHDASNCWTNNPVDEYDASHGIKQGSNELFSQASFYETTLGWDPLIWNYEALDIAKGVYPTLRYFDA